MSAEDLPRRRLNFIRRRRTQQRQGVMSVKEHLGELRNRLITALVAFFATSLIGIVLFEPISDILLRPLCAVDPDKLASRGCELISTGILEPFQVRLKVGVMVGLVLAAPVWVYQIWAFVMPGLTVRERRYTLPFVLSSLVFFLVGATIAYLTLPTGLNVLLGLGGENIRPLPRADQYFSFVGLMFLGFGLMFQLPLILFFLGLAGVISVDQLRHQRRIAIVGIVALAAVITPTQDPFTLFALAVPLYLLYELTIVLLARRKRRAH